MLNTWHILNKELNYYGIRLSNNGKCQFYINNKLKTQGIYRTITQLETTINNHTDNFKNLLKDAVDFISAPSQPYSYCDKRIEDLFIFSVKDLSILLLCFDCQESKEISSSLNMALNRDIKSFSKEQIYKFPDYKISIDWLYRRIRRLYYIKKLLTFSLMGKDKISKYNIKMASGLSGPWANLDLPMQERCFSWDDTEFNKDTTKQKQKQQRYRKGFEEYNGDGRVAEGHYFSDPRNEPFSWNDRKNSSPYPSRNMLMR